MPTVSLDNDFPVYADVDMADAYLDGAYHGDTWRSLDENAKGRSLVTATRTLNRQSWVGEVEVAGQDLAWPRINTGMTGVDGTTPDDIVNASIEMALSLVDGSELQNQQTTAERIRSLTAGSVSITNFRGINSATRFPQIVNELVAEYLSGGPEGMIGIGMKVTGADTETIFPIEVGFTQGV